ncbi:MAG: segregation/condensation protein A [Rhodospirillaceae bacterium]|nr:segregation/condensation protein A [Rhodospirillaceae bacterium]
MKKQEENSSVFNELSHESPIEDENIPLIVDIDGYEGPLDALLNLARLQKVDLSQISILQLAEQYLAFIRSARDLKIEIAADYLVMAAWLAFMKSRLLLPDPSPDEEPTGEEMAQALARRLRILSAMREAAKKIFSLPRENHEFYYRGEDSDVKIVKISVLEASLFDLLMGYAAQNARVKKSNLVIKPPEVYSMEDAYDRLTMALGSVPDWEVLTKFLPKVTDQPLLERSAIASTLSASLELVKEGKIKLKQTKPFGTIYLKRYGDEQ